LTEYYLGKLNQTWIILSSTALGDDGVRKLRKD